MTTPRKPDAPVFMIEGVHRQENGIYFATQEENKMIIYSGSSLVMSIKGPLIDMIYHF